MKVELFGAVVAVIGGLAAQTAALPDPMVRFDMKEMNGAKVRDVSGHGCDLTLGSTVSIVDDVWFGKVVKVTGQMTDWASFACPVVTNTTVAFWLRLDAADSSIPADGVEMNRIPYVMNTGYSGFAINYGREGSLLTMINQNNQPQTNYIGPSPNREEWHHVAFTVSYADDGAFGTLTVLAYLDGALFRTTTAANNKEMRTAGVNTVVLFNTGDNDRCTRPTSGLFTDFRFYDSCLAADQIQALMNDVVSKTLVMRYAFEELSTGVDADGRHSTPEATGFGSPMVLGKNMMLVEDGVDGRALRFMSTTEVGGLVKLPPCLLTERTYSVWVRNSSRR